MIKFTYALKQKIIYSENTIIKPGSHYCLCSPFQLPVRSQWDEELILIGKGLPGMSRTSVWRVGVAQKKVWFSKSKIQKPNALST